MSDKESELIARLMDGDMGAYDELMPNARPGDRANFENAIKKAKEIYEEQDPIPDGRSIRDMTCFDELDIEKMS